MRKILKTIFMLKYQHIMVFDYQDELKKLITAKQLVEVSLIGAPTYKVAYLLSANDDYLTFAEISSSATFSGVILCRMNQVDWISSESLYVDELSKQITDESLYKQATDNIKNFKKFTPSGFITAFAGTSTIIELTDEDENVFAGRIVGHGEQHLLVDEYYAENQQRFARKYFNIANISRMAVDVPWLRTISRSLADKNL